MPKAQNSGTLLFFLHPVQELAKMLLTTSKSCANRPILETVFMLHLGGDKMPMAHL